MAVGVQRTMCRGVRLCLACALALCVSAACPAPARAGGHDAGLVSLSFGATLGHTFNYDRESDTSVELTGDDILVTDTGITNASGGDTYSEANLSLYLSSGYFVADNTELGLSLSAMQAWYSGGGRSDFSVYDGRVYLKVFCETDGPVTPYMKVQTGASRVKTGDYEQTDATFGGVVGAEFYGMGPVSWFVEFSSEWTDLSGDLDGAEWQNQLYVGVSFYKDLHRKRREQAELAPLPEAVLEPLPSEVEVPPAAAE